MSKQVIHAHDKLVGDMVDRKKTFQALQIRKAMADRRGCCSKSYGAGIHLERW